MRSTFRILALPFLAFLFFVPLFAGAVAAEKGHDVTIYERKDNIGGQAATAANGPWGDRTLKHVNVAAYATLTVKVRYAPRIEQHRSSTRLSL